MTQERTSSTIHSFGCTCCTPQMSRRQFVCTTAAAGVTAPAVAAGIGGKAFAQTAATTGQAPARPILIKGGCVLSIDRAVGDFEQADVLVEGSRIAAVRPNIDAPNAE